MTMHRYGLPLVLVAVLVGTMNVRAQRIDLDLTTAARPIPEAEPDGEHAVTESGGGSASSSEVKAAPLRVRLLRMPPTCQVGEPIVFDVELQNISREPIMLPWTLDPSNEGHTTAPAIFPVMTIGLRLSRPGIPEIVEGGDVLYGDPSDAFTIRKLAPEERVVIRANAMCTTVNYHDERAHRRGKRPFRIFVVVVLKKSSTMLDRSISSNSFPVEIMYPEQ